jgi:hypothetical protein
MWCDDYRHGLNSRGHINLNENAELQQSNERAARYGMRLDTLKFYEDFAQKTTHSFDEFMERMQDLAGKVGVTLTDLLPTVMGHPGGEGAGDFPILDDPNDLFTHPDRPFTPLPPGRVPGTTTLVSMMREPRMTIRKSK